jgi:polyhydroxybutyrate depolymerase
MKSIYPEKVSALAMHKYYLSFILLFVMGISGVCHANSLVSETKKGFYRISIVVNHIQRSASVYIPTTLAIGTKKPLVVLLHGGGGNGASALDNDGWAAKAEQDGFYIVAPDGLGLRPQLPTDFKANPAVWNSGQFSTKAPNAGIDDVAFIGQLLDELKPVLGYDSTRVFSTGHSNGGGMTFRLAAQLSHRFTAIAMVAGRMAVENPKPEKPLPTLYIVGTADPLMPLAGGEVKSQWSGSWTNLPVATQLSTWAQAVQCETDAQLVSNENNVKTMRYRSKMNGPTVTVVYLTGHGHAWPGGRQVLPEKMMGPNVSKVDATSMIWAFFQGQ